MEGIIQAIRDWCNMRFQRIGNYASAGDIPTQTSQLTNDSGYLTDVPIATESSIGGVRVDGTTIIIDADGTIHTVSSQELIESILGGES